MRINRIIPVIFLLIHSLIVYGQEDNRSHVRFYTPEEYELLRGGGDTILYEDFGGGEIPAGWSVFDNTGNGYDWRWSDQGPTGPYSNYAGPINSTTGYNGFMLYDADAFDITTTKDAWFEMAPLDLSAYPHIVIIFEEFMRYCCTSSGGFWVEVSTDGFITQTVYDVSLGLGGADASDNPVIPEVDISDAAALQSDVRIRFHFTTNIAYFWMVDDILIKTPFDNEMILNEYFVSFESEGFYSSIPVEHLHGMNFSAEVRSNGINDQTNVVLNTLIKDNTNTEIYNQSSESITISYLQTDTLNIEEYYTLPDQDTGTYKIHLSVLQDQTDDNPENNSVILTSKVTHNTYGRALFQNYKTGPQYFVDGDDGDGIGCTYYLITEDTLQSVSVLLDSATSPGITLIGRVYTDDDPPVEIISSDEYTVTEDDPGNRVTLPLASTGNGEEIVSPGTYIAFVEGYWGDGDFIVAADESVFQGYFTNRLRIMDNWYSGLSCVPFINLNLYRTLYNSGTDEISVEQEKVRIFPNPSSGTVNITSSDNSVVYIYNMMGELLLADETPERSHKIDLSEYPDVCYIVKIVGEGHVVNRKIFIIK